MKTQTIKWVTATEDKVILLPSGPGLTYLQERYRDRLTKGLVDIAGQKLSALEFEPGAKIKHFSASQNNHTNQFDIHIFTFSEQTIKFSFSAWLKDEPKEQNASRTNTKANTPDSGREGVEQTSGTIVPKKA
jgi:hypothetical protein